MSTFCESRRYRLGERYFASRHLRPRGVAILCDMHSLMLVGFFMYLSMDDFLPGCLFAVVVI